MTERTLLARVAQAMIEQPDLESLCGSGAAALADALDADGALVHLVEPDGSTTVAGGGLVLPHGHGVVGRVVADGVAAVLRDDSPRNAAHRALLGLQEGQRVSRLCVPIRSRLTGDRPAPAASAVVGVVAVHSYPSREFTADEVALAQQVADLLGLRVGLDLALRELSDLGHGWEQVVAATIAAQETERRRLAGELHDGVTQVIASVAFHLSAAESAYADGDNADGAVQLRAAHELADLAFDETRNAIAGLHSPVLDDLGLAAALVSMSRAVPSVAVEVDAEDLELPEHVSGALFRVAQEAVQNAVKHADATTVRIRLGARLGRVVLTVIDDGRGFVVPARFTTATRAGGVARYGLVGMAERVELLGGNLSVTSGPGDGTSVEVSVPIPAAEAR